MTEDRLTKLASRVEEWRELGRGGSLGIGDEDTAWLVSEVSRLRDDQQQRMQGAFKLQDERDLMRLMIARQLTPLDVATTHVEIVRRKGDEYTPEERDNVLAIVESHVKEARSALFTNLKEADS